MKSELKKILYDLFRDGRLINPGEWQSQKIDHSMKELLDVFFEISIPEEIEVLQTLCSPDLPWAENHFKERICGEPLNPGVQYKYWPYYKEGSFLEADNGTKFSHTYMERFWPKYAGDDNGYSDCKGIRYPYGDYNDIVQQLKKNNYTRQAFLSIWHPEDQYDTGVRKPCTIGYHFQIRDNYLHITYLIRSCDAIRHFKNDIYLAGRLMQHTIQLVDPILKTGMLTVWIGNLHCFESDLYTLKKWIL